MESSDFAEDCRNLVVGRDVLVRHPILLFFSGKGIVGRPTATT
jgi:hypothetical protein